VTELEEQGPALSPLAVQLADERVPLRLVREVLDAKDPVVAEEYCQVLVAAAETWEMEYAQWLANSIEQCFPR
jgi:hypothetical protein